MKKPLISIIIPVYNQAKTLKNTLESIKQQTLKDYEIILIDDASADNPCKIAQNYTNNIIKNAKNLGPSVTRNKGIKASKSDILAFIDSDCIATKNWLEKIYKEFNNPAIKIIMGQVKIPESTLLGNSISALGFPAGANLGFEKVWKVKNGYTNHVSSCNMAIRKEIFKKYGMFDETFLLAGGEDSEFSLRLAQNGILVKYIPEVLIYHEPRKSLKSFIRWQVYRGRSNYHFKKRVKNIKSLIKLRIWYAKNVILSNISDPKIVLIFPLLILSFILQQYGYIKVQKPTDVYIILTGN